MTRRTEERAAACIAAALWALSAASLAWMAHFALGS